jgi:hypothetical protein
MHIVFTYESQNKYTMKLIALGCSLTEHSNWVWHLSRLIGIPAHNYGISSSSNLLQVHRFQELILSNTFESDDLLIWQITGATRIHKRIIDIDAVNEGITKLKNVKRHHVNSVIPNIFDQQTRFDLLSHSPVINAKATIAHDSAQDLQTLLANIIMASKICRVLVFVGWDDALVIDEINHSAALFDLLTQHSVPYISNSYVEWTRANNLPFWEDGWHPSETAGIAFAEQVLHPTLKQLEYI